MAGDLYIDWNKQCELLQWDPKRYCAPFVNSSGGFPAGNCCFNHPKDSPLHPTSPPMAKGKPFRIEDYKDEFRRLGITSQRKELKDEIKAGKPPPGVPKTVNGVKVYPRRHFA